MEVTNILNLIMNHGVGFVLIALVLYFGIRVGNIGVEVLNDKVTKQRHRLDIEKRMNLSNKINSIIRNARLELDADYIGVFELHNGVNNINGIPFLHMSETYESYKPGLISQQGSLQNLNALNFSVFLTSIQKLPYLILNTNFKENEKAINLYDLLERQEIQHYAASALTDKYQKIIGYVCIKNRSKEMKEKEIGKVQSLAVAISTILDISENGKHKTKSDLKEL